VSTKPLEDTKGKSHLVGRRAWPEALKRQMVAETLEPGSSVSIVARRHDVNTNQLFKWRRELLPKAVPAVVETSTMVPVEIVAERPRRRRVEHKGVGVSTTRSLERSIFGRRLSAST
jgi:transposase-like protein